MEEEAAKICDSTLINEIAKSNKEAFKTFYNRNVRRVFSFIFKITGNPKMTEEITNDVMFEVWKNAKSYKGKSSVMTWVFGIAHNKALNEIRKKTPELLDPAEYSKVANSNGGVEEKIVKKDMAKSISQAIDQLSPDHKAVIELTFYQGLSYQEIAELMKSPVNTVKTRMFYAKEKLKNILMEYGIRDEVI